MKHLQEMLALDAVRVFRNLYANPVVLIHKPNGLISFCINVRKLNSKTKRDTYALTSINEIFDILCSSRWFSSLDIKVKVEEGDEEKTRAIRVLQAQQNALWLVKCPGAFQRRMESCLGNMNMQPCSTLMIPLFSPNVWRAYWEAGEKIFQVGLKLSPVKCNLF